MKKKIYSAVIVLSLAAPAMVVAADENNADVHGLVELGVRAVNTNANSAFFQEFRELDDSVLGTIQLDVLKGAYHFQLDAENPGADDQSFQLKGGKYGDFKYKFNYDEMPHNYTFDAITPYTGVGTQYLTIVGSPATTSTWTKFDYAVDHKSYGGELEVSLHSPFYVNLGADRREQTGLRPYSLLGTAHSAASINEGPEPISNATNNLNLKGGYLGESVSASLTGSLSSFENDNKYFQVGALSVDTNKVLAPDNEYRKIAADLSWRDLPLGSVLAAGLSHANLKNDFTASDINYTAAMVTALTAGTALNRTTFEGDIDYNNATIALTSQPLDKLDTKVYYNYLERDNKSSVISYGTAPASTNNAQELLSYEKNTAGFDVGYRLPNKTKLDAGYEYLKIDRTTALPAYTTTTTFYRYDNPESTRDDSIYVGLKNSTLEWVTAKIKYTRLDRDSDINPTNVNATVLPLYTTRFDTLDKTMDEWKLGFEFYPMENLDLGLNFTHRYSDFDENNSSRDNDKRQSVYTDVTWRAAQAVTLSGFVGYEKTEVDSNKRPGLQLSPTWVETTDDDFWTYGLTANIAATDTLTFNLSWQHQESDGAVDFTSLIGTTYANITESDDYTKNTLEAKAIYAIDPKLKMTLGYLYEKLKYSDINYANYANVVGTSYYSGLYADPNYEANVGYLMVSYGF